MLLNRTTQNVVSNQLYISVNDLLQLPNSNILEVGEHVIFVLLCLPWCQVSYEKRCELPTHSVKVLSQNVLHLYCAVMPCTIRDVLYRSHALFVRFHLSSL